jgi:hypothetical protein
LACMHKYFETVSKRMGGNQRGEYKRKRTELLLQIEQIDIAAEQEELTQEMWLKI